MRIKVDGGILAGGLSTRMGGADKGLQPYKNKAMVSWVYEALKPYVDNIHINCNRNHPLYQAISPNLCEDTISGFQGPLAGLVSLMEASSADYLLISPCDTPLLPAEYARRMLAELTILLDRKPSLPLLLAAKDAHRNHPLHLCISTQFKGAIEATLDLGERRVMKWINANQPHWVDFSDFPTHFSNFNSKEDLGRTGASFQTK